MSQEEELQFDVLIIGAGPAGLSAAIRLAQLNQQREQALSIAVLEKGAEVGAHLISGAVLEPSALAQLIPDYQQVKAPLDTPVIQDRFFYFSSRQAFRLPTPSTMKNQGNSLIKLGVFCRWLAEQAEQLGVNIFPGFAASELIFDQYRVVGVKTSDRGLDKKGQATAHFEAGIRIKCKQLLLAEGCRGYLSEKIIARYQLRADSGPQTYGIGVKELWEVDSPHYHTGHVMHSVGWPLDQATYGGSFVYHLSNNKVALGLIVGLDYQNPYCDPFAELQQFKTHPSIKKLLTGGRCIGYGARALNEGGWQAIPKLSFPGGLLIGCAAGFVNVGKIKGIHNAMFSGLYAAELIANTKDDLSGKEFKEFTDKIKQSSIGQELYKVRNLRPSFHKNLYCGLAYSAIDQYLLRGKAPWTWHNQIDHNSLKPAKKITKINYPKADGKITFDKRSLLALTGVAHSEDQPCHLKLTDPQLALSVNLAQYDSPEQFYCPANVYEIVNINGETQLQINASNCIHCKTCDIKDPRQNIHWCPPEGGDGPNYQEM